MRPEIVQLRNSVEESANDLNQICSTMEILLSSMYEANEAANPIREAMALLWKNTLEVRDTLDVYKRQLLLEAANPALLWMIFWILIGKAEKPLDTFCISVASGRIAAATWFICVANSFMASPFSDLLTVDNLEIAFTVEVSPLDFWTPDKAFNAGAIFFSFPIPVLFKLAAACLLYTSTTTRKQHLMN